jgi:hypothetical protein
MQDIIKSALEKLPEIIKAAASSPLGVISLLSILFSALAYTFFRKSNERWRLTSLSIFFVGCLAFGYVALPSTRNPELRNVGLTELPSAVTKFNASAKLAKDNKTITPGTPIPSDLRQVMNKFEESWVASSLEEKKKIQQKDLFTALDSDIRIHRILEDGSESKPESQRWADEAIQFFSEAQSGTLLTDAILNKAAIFLDIAQLNNNDKELFEKMAKDGDKLMNRAYQTASPEQKPEVLRITSRFYYLLARPRSFRLSEDWDNNYLQLAYQKIQEAYALAPNDIKNINQFTRATMRYAKNPPQDKNPEWTTKIRGARDKLQSAFISNSNNLTTLEQRLSPLNVIGTATLEYAARTWGESKIKNNKELGSTLIQDIDSVGLPRLREAVALLQNSELRKSYGFDLYFDIARMLAIKSSILKSIGKPSESEEAFIELRKNLAQAKENAKTSQIESAIKNINGEITFMLLTEKQRTQLRKSMSIG